MSDQDYPSKVMEPAVYQPDLLTQSLYWIEPDLPHKQVIVVTTDHGTLYHGRDGSHVHDWGVMLNPAKRQFRQLTQELHLQDDGKNWKGGAAFFCYIVPLEYGGQGPHFAIRMAMPMLDFIFPQDSKPQGLRMLALEQAFSSDAYPLLVQGLLAHLHREDQLAEAHLPQAVDQPPAEASGVDEHGVRFEFVDFASHHVG